MDSKTFVFYFICSEIDLEDLECLKHLILSDIVEP